MLDSSFPSGAGGAFDTVRARLVYSDLALHSNFLLGDVSSFVSSSHDDSLLLIMSLI